MIILILAMLFALLWKNCAIVQSPQTGGPEQLEIDVSFVSIAETKAVSQNSLKYV